MMYVMHLLFIVIAVSLDGVTVGITYGMRKITIAITSLLIIMLCSGIIVFTSMIIGHGVRQFITPHTAQQIGGVVLICLGMFITYSIWRSHTEEHEKVPVKNRPPLTSVIRDPTSADQDKSGSISAGEAFILGIALALDALGAGFGAAMLGYSPMLTAFLIAFTSGLFVFIGMKIGLTLTKNKSITKFTYLPPLLLISIGLASLF